MNPLFEAALEISQFLRSEGREFCLIGGLAVQKWGEPRTTLDVDLTVLTSFGEEDAVIGPLLGRFEARVPDAHAFARMYRVLLIRASAGIDVDISLGALPYEVGMVRRAVSVTFAPGVVLPCCTAEDLFILKAFASRPRDWLDVEAIALRRPDLDTAYIIEHLTLLCDLKEDPESLERAKSILFKRR
jgi:hypothetical protein